MTVYTKDKIMDEEQELNLIDAVTNSTKDLRNLKVELRTYRVCLAAVKRYAWALSEVPEKHLTYELCLAAVSQKSAYIPLYTIPREHFTEELSLNAIKNGHLKRLHHIPRKYRSYEVCLELVKKRPSQLLYVLDMYRTYELCLTAVKRSGSVLRYVPEGYLTVELCRIARKKAPMNSRFYIPSQVMDLIRAMEAVEKGAR